MADMDPAQAAQYAQGDQQAAQGGLDGGGLSGGPLAPDEQSTALSAVSSAPMDRLFDGDTPGPSVRELRADYEMPKDLAIASRGILRTATGSGVPPAFEIAFGSFLAYLRRSKGGQDDADAAENAYGDLAEGET